MAGEGGGGGGGGGGSSATSSSSKELQTLLDAIKSSEVVESRVQLITQLGDLDLAGQKSELATLAGCLSELWEDFTCLDASQCLLNKAILRVAAKYVDSCWAGCVVQILRLGVKASAWCGKHLKMTLMSTGESQEEEHCNIFFELLLDFLSFSAASLVALTRQPVSTDSTSTVVVERFILEQLNLAKDVVSEIKRINSFSSEVLKSTQSLIDASLNLCKEYSLAVNWDSVHARAENGQIRTDCEEVNFKNHIIAMTKCAIEKFREIGIVAANDGGNLVAILNVCWKGLPTLLQLGNGLMTEPRNVQDNIASLTSLVNESLRCAGEAWSSPVKEAVSVAEARRAFLPAKFYLMIAVKISSLYPSQAYLAYKEIALCTLRIFAFQVFLSCDKPLNTAAEVALELLEKTSLDLLKSLLNSVEVKQEHKFELLDWLFIDECWSNSSLGDSSSSHHMLPLVEIFSISSETMPGARELLLGRVALFHALLWYPICLKEDVKIKLTRKLGWLLDILVDEKVYSSVLNVHIPVLYVSGKTTELLWQPMFFALLHALKTFMIVVSSSLVWTELEGFLLENLFHPHFLCVEIIMELWCFLVRYAETDMVSCIIDKLFSLMKLLAYPESALIPCSPLRKLARAICLLLVNCSQSMVDQVYTSVVSDDRSQLSSAMCLAMLLEGFPLNSLSDNIRSNAKEKMITDYFSFIGSFNNKLLTTGSSSECGIPVFALSATLQSRQVSLSDVEMKTLKFLVNVIHYLRNPVDKIMNDHYHKLLSETLRIVSNMEHLYESDEMEEVILELQKLFISGQAASDNWLHQCKPYLACFMGGLGDFKMSESNDCAKSNAVWELYHMLFRERHWALVHVAIAAFGYFAARTACSQLWKFVPQDAALSYDLIAGCEANEEMFMSALKAFLEKEIALPTITPSFDQVDLLMKEGMVLKKFVQTIPYPHIEDVEGESMEIDVDNQSNKRRKLPDEIRKGLELIESGLKVLGDGLSMWQESQLECPELHDKISSHFSELEGVIGQLTSFAGK